jgi:cytosine/adenosine deaminase-related metal-dependent hydrolase/SAM-dependent methyltransferase
VIRSETAEAPAVQVSPTEGYRRWSNVYDSEANPITSLEGRFLRRLLPPIKGRDIVDFGCGTGRWLEVLAARSPRTLTGVDASAQMLAHAARKLAGRALLLNGNCKNPPIQSASADLILCSFVLGYLPSLPPFAGQIRRIVRPGADIFVSDLHPETQLKFGWRRGFRDANQRVELQTHWRSLDSILSEFEQQGIRPVAILEIPFGEPEFKILEAAGKSASIGEFRDHPAIYLLHLRSADSRVRDTQLNSRGELVATVSGARVALGSRECLKAELGLEDGRISSISSRSARLFSPPLAAQCVDLSEFLILPGLINAHDHLEFALFPRLGRGGYQNFVEWATDIHRPAESPIREHRSVPKNTRLWWGAIRNLLCGATTVCHHNPYVAEVFENDFPVRVVRDFGWAHSLAMEMEIAGKHADTPAGQPFILHLGEGMDNASAEELFQLDRVGALTGRTVVVHGLALNAEGRRLLRDRGAALVWCPTSNVFLFGRTHQQETIGQLVSVALGSDSSLTAQGDLLDELNFACEQVRVSPDDLYAQVTLQSADILRLESGQGSLRVGAVADLIATRDRNLTPAETLARSTYRDVELVIVGGRVQLASPSIKERLAGELAEGLEPLEIDGELRWIRAPLARLFAHARSALGHDLTMNGRAVNDGAV